MKQMVGFAAGRQRPVIFVKWRLRTRGYRNQHRHDHRVLRPDPVDLVADEGIIV
jgi:hypothetical protein